MPFMGGAGGPQTVGRLGPFAVTYQTANISNPGDNGALVGPTLAAGTLILATWIETTTPWAAATSVDEAIIVLNTNTDALLDITSGAALNGATMELQTSGAGLFNPVFLRSGTDRLAIAIYSTGALTAGAGNIYALTASIA